MNTDHQAQTQICDWCAGDRDADGTAAYFDAMSDHYDADNAAGGA